MVIIVHGAKIRPFKGSDILTEVPLIDGWVKKVLNYFVLKKETQNCNTNIDTMM